MGIASLIRALATSLLLLGTLAACTTNDNTSTSTTAAQLDGRTFLLQQAVGYVPVEGSVIRLSFEDSEMDSYAGCNSFNSAYSISNGSLVLGSGSMTLMGCGPALAAQDEWLAQFLGSKPSLVLDGDTLTLTSGNVVLKFLDRVVADPNRPLAGPTWTVDTLLSGAAASSIVTSLEKPTLFFEESGTFIVTTGCSTGAGNYAATGTALTFTTASFASSTCEDAAAVSLLQHLAKVFADGTTTYSIVAARLTIEQGTVGVMATASE